jgi:MFS family permease
MTATTADPIDPSVPAAQAYPSERYGWYVVAVLMLAYTVSYIDRQMMTLLVDPVRATLGISDLQLSLLHGLAFAVFYTVLGLPMGRIADRYSRRNLITAGIATWSLMTSLCGVAKSYGQLFAARCGVGVGEATLSPGAYSLLTDYFPPEKRARALSVYTSGIYIGAAAATFGGGYLITRIPPMDLPLLGQREPWQIIFLLIGLLGLPVALLILTTVKEPVRREVSSHYRVKASLGETWAYVRKNLPAFALITFGISIFATLTNGVKGWIPTFLMRTYGLTPAEVGVQFGLVLLVFGALGVAGGGFMASAMKSGTGRSPNVKVAALGALLIIPFGIAAPLMPSASLALAVYCVVIFLCGVPFGVGAAAIQEITPNQMRGTVSAMYLFGVNLLGIGTGPTLVAVFTDLVFKDDLALRYSLAAIVAVTAPLSLLLLTTGLRFHKRAIEQRDF